MKVAITADPTLPVPPTLYGGIERVIDMLIKGLVKRGHEVTLFAHKDSEVPCKHVSYNGEDSNSKRDTWLNMLQISSIRSEGFDVIHSFGRLAYLTMLMPTSLPKIMSYQREPAISKVRRAMRFSKKETLHFTGCSAYIANQIKPFAPVCAIPNGVPIEQYIFREKVADDAPLVFLGRVEYIKGAHLAIDVARKSGRRLIIAGNIPDDQRSKEYFEQMIKPQLDAHIEYIGPVNDSQKNEILGGAYAFLMPILWNEPFGIVMAEALACGTPVIGMDRGSVPEVVEHGVNGFRCQSADEMVSAVNKINQLKRIDARIQAEERFSDQAIVRLYEALYQKIIPSYVHC